MCRNNFARGAFGEVLRLILKLCGSERTRSGRRSNHTTEQRTANRLKVYFSGMPLASVS